MEKPYLVGTRFGRLTVIARTENKAKKWSRWVCQCDCGKTCIATGSMLQQGKKKSCNCLRSEKCRERALNNNPSIALVGDEGSMNKLYAVYKWQAKKRAFTFELTAAMFRELTSKPCVYCGKEPAQRYAPAKSNAPYIYNGIDRIDNKLGYTIDNCASCCGTCNDMKRIRTVEDFLAACSRVTNFQNSKKLAEMSNSDS